MLRKKKTKNEKKNINHDAYKSLLNCCFKAKSLSLDKACVQTYRIATASKPASQSTSQPANNTGLYCFLFIHMQCSSLVYERTCFKPGLMLQICYNGFTKRFFFLLVYYWSYGFLESKFMRAGVSSRIYS